MDERETPCCDPGPEPINEQRSEMKNIEINPLSYGYLVRVRCQSFAIETKERLIEKLTKYINDPQKVEKDWMSNKQL